MRLLDILFACKNASAIKPVEAEDFQDIWSSISAALTSKTMCSLVIRWQHLTIVKNSDKNIMEKSMFINFLRLRYSESPYKAHAGIKV